MKITDIPLSRVMAKARREGRKNQTRRIVKPSVKGCSVGAYTSPGEPTEVINVQEDGDPWEDIPCPYGQPGDRLRWLTTWATLKKWDHLKPTEVAELVGNSSEVWTAHQSDEPPEGFGKLRAGRFMPLDLREWTLPEDELDAVRIARLQDISEEDAKAEGLDFVSDGGARYGIKGLPSSWSDNPIESYRALWESINGPGAWDANSWVWVLEFKP